MTNQTQPGSGDPQAQQMGQTEAQEMPEAHVGAHVARVRQQQQLPANRMLQNHPREGCEDYKAMLKQQQEQQQAHGSDLFL